MQENSQSSDFANSAGIIEKICNVFFDQIAGHRFCLPDVS